LDLEIRIAEVQFFVQLFHEEKEISLALVSLYSRLDPTLLHLSFNTLWSCQYQGDMVLQFIDVKTIQAVVSMVPHTPVIQGQPAEGRFFLMENPGLDVAVMTGTEEDLPGEELNDAAGAQDT
jgi:hypothetical protein